MRRTVRAAAQAGLALAAVDRGLGLERAGHAVRVAEVAQRRAAELERARQRGAQRRQQALAARPAEAVAARARVDAGPEQRLAGVDVAGADDDVAGQQRRLDRRRAALQRGVQRLRREAPGRTARRPAAPAASAAGAASSAGDQTTAPKRRGSVRRSVPRSVTRSKWSCGPGAGGARRQAPASPTCPGAAAARRRAGRLRHAHRAAAAATGTCRAARPRPACEPTSASRRAAQRPAQRLAQAHRQHAGAAQGARQCSAA